MNTTRPAWKTLPAPRPRYVRVTALDGHGNDVHHDLPINTDSQCRRAQRIMRETGYDSLNVWHGLPMATDSYQSSGCFRA
jgi:hypothetical protein